MTKRRRTVSNVFKIIFPILLAMDSVDPDADCFYTILRDTLNANLRDRQTLIQLVGHLVAHDLNRSRSVINIIKRCRNGE
jgi:hypothetical protein